MAATVIPFARPVACPGHADGRLTPAGIALIRRRYAREIATGLVRRIEWPGGDHGDAAHVMDADGEVLVSLYVDGGLVHAVGALGRARVAAGQGRTVAAALDALAARTGIPALSSPARPG